MSSYALITGASSGLGEEFARLFAKDKTSVVLVARREDRLKKLKLELDAFGIKTEILSLDLTKTDSIKKLLNYLETKKIEIEYLVNNAGYGQSGTFSDISLEHNIGQIDLNVRALTELTYRLLPNMLMNKRGRILNIGSTAGYQPGPYMAVYYASKAYVNSFSEALHHELKESGVTVTLSCPGPTVTEFSKVAGTAQSKLFKMSTMSGPVVAQQAYRAMMKGQRTIIHGTRNRIGAHMVGLAPKSAILNITARLNFPEKSHD